MFRILDSRNRLRLSPSNGISNRAVSNFLLPRGGNTARIKSLVTIPPYVHVRALAYHDQSKRVEMRVKLIPTAELETRYRSICQAQPPSNRRGAQRAGTASATSCPLDLFSNQNCPRMCPDVQQVHACGSARVPRSTIAATPRASLAQSEWRDSHVRPLRLSRMECRDHHHHVRFLGFQDWETVRYELLTICYSIIALSVVSKETILETI